MSTRLTALCATKISNSVNCSNVAYIVDAPVPTARKVTLTNEERGTRVIDIDIIDKRISSLKWQRPGHIARRINGPKTSQIETADRHA